MIAYLRPCGLVLLIALLLLSTTTTSTSATTVVALDDRSHAHPKHSSHPSVSQAVKCKGVLAGYKQEARAFCTAFLQQRITTATVVVAADPQTRTIQTTATESQTTTTTTTTTSAAVVVETLATTTTILQRRQPAPQETGDSLERRRRRSLKSALSGYGAEVIADACSLYLYDRPYQAQTTTITSTAAASISTSTVSALVTNTATSTQLSIIATTTTTTTAQATQSIAVNHLVAPGFEQCARTDYTAVVVSPQPDPVACPWTIQRTTVNSGINNIAAYRRDSPMYFYFLPDFGETVTLSQVLTDITPDAAYTLTYWRARGQPNCPITLTLDGAQQQVDSMDDVPLFTRSPAEYLQASFVFTPTNAQPTLTLGLTCGPQRTGNVWVDDLVFARSL